MAESPLKLRHKQMNFFKNIQYIAKILLLKFFILFLSLGIFFLLAEMTIRLIIPQKEVIGRVFEYTDKGLRCNRSNGIAKSHYFNRDVIYKFYEPHLRDTPLIEDSIKILTVGDSFVFGIFLNKEEVITSNLQKFADEEFGKNKFYFLNAGVGGWGCADYTAFLEDYIDRIKPHIVLIIMNNYDIDRTIGTRLFDFNSDRILQRRLSRDHFFYINKIMNLIPAYEWLIYNSHFVRLLRSAITNFLVTIPRKNTQSKRMVNNFYLKTDNHCDFYIEFNKALFIYLKDLCKRWNIDLYITTTGCISLEDTYNYNRCTKYFVNNIAKEFFQSIDIPFYDISQHILKVMKERKDYYFFPDGHPNPKGAELIAQNIWQYFLKQQLKEYLS